MKTPMPTPFPLLGSLAELHGLRLQGFPKDQLLLLSPPQAATALPSGPLLLMVLTRPRQHLLTLLLLLLLPHRPLQSLALRLFGLLFRHLAATRRGPKPEKTLKNSLSMAFPMLFNLVSLSFPRF